MSGEKLNIWGKPGCELPSGKLCVACCNYFNVTVFESPPGKLCRFAKPGEGCDIVANPNRNQKVIRTREQVCEPYHCSQSDEITQTALRVTAYHLGQVTTAELVAGGKE